MENIIVCKKLYLNIINEKSVTQNLQLLGNNKIVSFKFYKHVMYKHILKTIQIKK